MLVVTVADLLGELVVALDEGVVDQLVLFSDQGAHAHDLLVESSPAPCEMRLACLFRPSLQRLAEAARHVVFGALVAGLREDLAGLAELHQYAPAVRRGLVDLGIEKGRLV